MISKAMVVGAYQRKLEELATMPNMELTVIVPPRWRDDRGETRLERAFTRGYRLVETPIALNGHFHLHFYPRLSEALEEAKPDLVHVDEEPYNVAAWQTVRWAARRGVPALFFTWQNLLRRYPPPFSWMEQYCYTHAAAAIAGNQEAERVLRAKGFRGPVWVIPQFGVDPELFSHAAANRHGVPPLIIGYAGGLVPEKGVDVLLEAVALCQEQAAAVVAQPGRSVPCCELHIAGEGRERQRLQALARQLGLEHVTTFLPRLPSLAMADFYRSLHVLVLPSRTLPNWKEQFGRVLIEAMASGVPVVGSTCGEIPNVIGDAGLIFPENDPHALAAMLMELASNAQLRAELSRRGRARVLEFYTQRRIAEATYAVYAAVLGQGR